MQVTYRAPRRSTMPARTLSTQTHSQGGKAPVDDNNCPCKSSYPLAACLGRHSAALFVCQHNGAGGSKHPEPFTRKYNKMLKKKRKKIYEKEEKLPPPSHANCANPFKGKAVAALRAFHTVQCFYLPHSRDAPLYALHIPVHV